MFYDQIPPEFVFYQDVRSAVKMPPLLLGCHKCCQVTTIAVKMPPLLSGCHKYCQDATNAVKIPPLQLSVACSDLSPVAGLALGGARRVRSPLAPRVPPRAPGPGGAACTRPPAGGALPGRAGRLWRRPGRRPGRLLAGVRLVATAQHLGAWTWGRRYKVGAEQTIGPFWFTKNWGNVRARKCL